MAQGITSFILQQEIYIIKMDNERFFVFFSQLTIQIKIQNGNHKLIFSEMFIRISTSNFFEA